MLALLMGSLAAGQVLLAAPPVPPLVTTPIASLPSAPSGSMLSNPGAYWPPLLAAPTAAIGWGSTYGSGAANATAGNQVGATNSTIAALVVGTVSVLPEAAETTSSGIFNTGAALYSMVSSRPDFRSLGEVAREMKQHPKVVVRVYTNEDIAKLK
jgi:hypothetical protein